jgi:putative transposase
VKAALHAAVQIVWWPNFGSRRVCLASGPCAGLFWDARWPGAPFVICERWALKVKAALHAAVQIGPGPNVRLHVRSKVLASGLFGRGGNYYCLVMKSTVWPHAPTHQLSAAGTYFVTAGTYLKGHHFRGGERCGVLQRGLLRVLSDAEWRVEGWAVFSNHYHFVAHSPATGRASLTEVLRELHTKTATWVNELDGKPKRKVWHNFWDTRLSFQASYLARLNYVHQNAVKHGLVAVANQYPWCSAGWFERAVTAATVRTIYGVKIDSVSVMDAYEPLKEW